MPVAPADYRQQALPHAYGPPTCQGVIRSIPEDFQVEELPLFEPEGEGEHALLQVRKRGLNTQVVAERLARCAGVPGKAVGYAGLKDRQAVTSQWFSVQVATEAGIDWSSLESEDLQVLQIRRHRWKLQRGDLAGNRFRLRIRGIDGAREALRERLEQVARGGVPNYFGEQRFGRDFGNLDQARAMFAGQRVADRHLRGLYLSSARALLFNRVLARRVAAGSWNHALPGEALILAEAGTLSAAVAEDPATQARVEAGELHPSGPLWGRGFAPVRGDAAGLERQVLADYPDWQRGLEQAGLKHERRALRLPAQGFVAEWLDDDLMLRFSLPAGSYATAVLRELFDYRTVAGMG